MERRRERRGEATDLALQAPGLGNIVVIDEGSAAAELGLVSGRRRGDLERVGVVMGAGVFRGDGRVVEGIRRSICDRYMGVRSARAGVVEHLDVAAGCAVVGGVVGVVALQVL